MARKGVVFFLLTLFIGTLAVAGTSHKNKFEHYEGTKTCLKCHKKAAKAFFHSQHYQWKGETPHLVNSEGEKHGKFTMINDFCTNPLPNWIGKIKNEEGKVIARGCSTCHAGKGLLPSTEMSREQLENIDCLICHASGYRRDLYATKDGGWKWRPILWKNQEGLDSVSKRISLPTRAMCLRCHSASGGGENFKRGDLEYGLADCEPDLDVHMASSGADLQCVDCHAGEDHRVKGRGVDLAATDSPSLLTCDNGDCHGPAPHELAVLDHHAKRVNCTVCHIPEYAKEAPTDMFRDWSNVHYNEEKGKYVYHQEMASNVQPEYAWFNGTSKAQFPKTPVKKNDKGQVVLVKPKGSKDDPTAKIHAFKVHKGRLPVLNDKQWLLPLNTERIYEHGDPERGVRDAAKHFYGIENPKYTWTDTVRYMGIFHEVSPAKEALGCMDCHGQEGRLDWKALGYKMDPLQARYSKKD